MSIKRINAAEIEQASLSGVANRPNQRTGFGNAGMTPQELKARYSALAFLAINKINELIEALGTDEREGDLLAAIYTHLIDPLDDKKRMSLSEWICEANTALGQSVTAVEYDPNAEKITISFGDGSKRVLDCPKQGPQGAPGEDGVSPTVAVAEVEGGYQITVTDANGSNTFLLPKGAKGDPGAPFEIFKLYMSVVEMQAGHADDDVPEGGFVLISTESVEDPDNAKLYVKGRASYRFLCDLSGATGIQGPAGSSIKFITKTGTSGLVDTYTVTLTDGTTSTYTVTNGKDGKDGADGKDGVDGKDGAQGPQGDPYTLTETDKQAIVDAVVAALPVYDGEVVTV